MNRPDQPMPPALDEIFGRHLKRSLALPELGNSDLETSEVQLHDAGLPQPADPAQAWRETVRVLSSNESHFDSSRLTPPTEWAILVAQQELNCAPAFAIGNYPQLVRSLQPMLSSAELSTLRPSGGAALNVPACASWAFAVGQKTWSPTHLLAAGVLRLAHHYEDAAKLLRTSEQKVPAEWKKAWTNELAALEWHQGNYQQAVIHWKHISETPIGSFNLGLAELFSDRPKQAKPHFAAAVSALPSDSGWQSLANLYLALAEMRMKG